MLWIEFVREIRLFWDQGDRLPRMFIDAPPDLATCHVHQKLQLVTQSSFLALHSQQSYWIATLASSTNKEVHSRCKISCNICPCNLKYLFFKWKLLNNLANVHDCEFGRTLKIYPKAIVTIKNLELNSV